MTDLITEAISEVLEQLEVEEIEITEEVIP